MAQSSIPVDLFNPGQVFACMGFLEAAELLVGNAVGSFEWLHLVSEARSKIVSTVITSLAGSSERMPYALRYTTLPLCPISTTPPGIVPRATAAFMIASMLAKFAPRVITGAFAASDASWATRLLLDTATIKRIKIRAIRNGTSRSDITITRSLQVITPRAFWLA